MMNGKVFNKELKMFPHQKAIFVWVYEEEKLKFCELERNFTRKFLNVSKDNFFDISK